MSGQDALLQKFVTRRMVVKGLAAIAFVACEIGCASPKSSTGVTPISAVTPLPSGSIIYTYTGHSEQVLAVAWSPDGYIASGSTDTSVQIYDALTGNHLYSYHGHTGEITAVTWSPGGRYIASSSADKCVQIWNISTGATLYTYRGYNVDQANTDPTKGVLPDLIYIVVWSLNGKRIAAVTQEYCGDECGVVLTWDALNEGHFSFYSTFPMYALAWSPDDRHFVTANAQTSGPGGVTQVVQIRQV